MTLALTTKRGDTFVRQFRVVRGSDPVLVSPEEILFTIKALASDPDPGLAQVSLTGGGVVIDDPGPPDPLLGVDALITVRISDAVMEGIAVGDYFHDLQVKENGGRKTTPRCGRFIVTQDFTATV